MFPAIFRRLFANEGKGPKLRTDIIPDTLPGTADDAKKLSTPRVLDGVQFNGEEDVTHYAVCTTAAGTAAKTVSIDNFKLVTSASVKIRFTNGNTAKNTTLNVASTGAKTIRYAGAAIPNNLIEKEKIYECVYDGSYWQLVGCIAPLSDAVDSESKTDSASSYAVKQAYDKAEDALNAANSIEPMEPATPEKLGGVKVGSGLKIASDGTISVDPWEAVPLNVPIGVVGVTFGGTDGRRAIMPGESTARENWVICDGGSDGKGGTVPDLRGRFVMTASEDYPAGSTGGSKTHSHTVSGTVGATTLVESQMPRHFHPIGVSSKFNYAPGNHDRYRASGDIAKNSTTSTDYTGGSQSHTHDFTGSTAQGNTLPPFYSLSYIIRIS